MFANKEKNIKILKEGQKFLSKNFVQSFLEKPIPFRYPCKLALKVDNTYEFYVLKILGAIKKICKNNIYEYPKKE